MLEILLIMFIYYSCTLMPLRGMQFSELTPKQLKRVEKHFAKYRRTSKGRQNPDMQIEEYFPILQKQAKTYLISAIVIAPIYLAFVFVIYPQMFF